MNTDFVPTSAENNLFNDTDSPRSHLDLRPHEFVAGLCTQLAANFETHRKVRRLLKLAPFLDAVENNPKFAFKYLSRNYLARGLTVADRAACFLHHYTRLNALLPDRVLRQVLHWDVLLHEIPEGDKRFTLTMGRSRPCYKEGELSLNLKVDGEIFFTLSFTIVPGWVVQSHAAEVLLISRLQGTWGCYPDQIKLATKAMLGVRPRALLLAALQGIALRMGISAIAAVSAVRQSSYSADSDAYFKNAYDTFFSETCMKESPSGFFLAAVPIEEIPMECISQNNRLRAKKNRLFKLRIRTAVAAWFDHHTPAPAVQSSTPEEP